jgi:cell division protein FtsI/penicillin-binding protein 2
LRHGLPAAALLVLVVAGGVVCATRGDSPEQATAKRFALAWQKGDMRAMYAELTDDARRRTPLRRFMAAYSAARQTTTMTSLRTGKPRERDGAWQIPVAASTRLFGTVRADLVLPVVAEGDGAGVDWRAHLTFPGMRVGERLSRSTSLPRRAALLARDGTILAHAGAERGVTGPIASAVVGQLGAIPADRLARVRALGWPADAQVGVSGLERVFDVRLAGTPGGVLRAGGRTLAAAVARAATDVRTTISPRVQEAVNAALGPRLGGIVAVDPRDGGLLGFAGIAFSGLQPPGSTFKLVTLSGVLEAGVAGPSSTFPVQTAATLSGVELQNANGESCGGTLANAFAVSCNSVFAPLGAKLGAKRLIAQAERFGFNKPSPIPGAAVSMIPAADEIGDDLAVGSTAIGQGRVQATALQMADIATAISRRGLRVPLTLELAQARRNRRTHAGARALSARSARTVEKLMLGVVRSGTGTAAAIPGVRVAGKTGTAELRATQDCKPKPDDPEACTNQAADTTDTDAWFASYAPAGDGHARIAVGVMFVSAGAGGETAAPAARQVLLAGLKR